MSKKVDLNAPRDNSGNHKKSRTNHSFSHPLPQRNEKEDNKESNVTEQNKEKEKTNSESESGENNESGENKKRRGGLGRRALTALTGGESGVAGRSFELADKVNATITFVKTAKFLPIILIILPIVIFLMLFVVLFDEDDSNTRTGGVIGLSGFEYYEGGCGKVKIPDGSLLDIDDYVAGVVSREVGGFTKETLKVFAIAARTHAIGNTRKAGSDPDSCYYVIPSITDTFQVYSPTTNETYINAAKETKGLVITIDGKIRGGSYYDASCVYTADQARSKDPNQTYNDNFYYIKFGGSFLSGYHFQPIPKSEASKAGTLNSWVNLSAQKGRPCAGNHGMGMSQNGSYYLENFEGYTWDKIIDYYFDGTAQIMSLYRGAGYSELGTIEFSTEYPIDPNNELYSNLKFLINRSLSDLLSSNGSSVEEFNNYIKSSVQKAGVGTRAGTVTAAVNLIGTLATSGVKLNYEWNGKYPYIGVNPNWGTQGNTSYNCSPSVYPYTTSNCYANYAWRSFDCSGFVLWAVMNGTQNPRMSQSQTSSPRNEISLDSSRAVCKPGGVLIKHGSHIVLVVGADDSKKSYIVAESTGSNVAAGTGGVKLSYYSYGKSGYVCANLNEIYGD